MNSLIFLMGQGFTPDLAPVHRIAIKAAILGPIILVAGIGFWFTAKAVWPKDKW
jgi:hypothetical protein